jgi:NADH-quinone oxidoreductase subunit G
LPFGSLAALRRTLFVAHPHMMRIGEIVPGNAADIQNLAKLGGNAGKAPFKPAVADFYLTNPIARASAVMAECSALAAASAKNPSMTAAE